MNKNTTFLKNIIFKYLPENFPTATSQKLALQFPQAYNVEHLTEIALAKVGGYDFVYASGYDFSDYSDSKTTSVNYNTKVIEIMSVENKIGSLRICCYNLFKNCVDYFFVPKENVKEVAERCYGKQKHKQRIKARYNTKKDSYTKLEKYRVKDFTTLATLS